jgi:hypothetical protein
VAAIIIVTEALTLIMVLVVGFPAPLVLLVRLALLVPVEILVVDIVAVILVAVGLRVIGKIKREIK